MRSDGRPAACCVLFRIIMMRYVLLASVSAAVISGAGERCALGQTEYTKDGEPSGIEEEIRWRVNRGRFDSASENLARGTAYSDVPASSGPLAPNQSLTLAARHHSEDMAECHSCPWRISNLWTVHQTFRESKGRAEGSSPGGSPDRSAITLYRGDSGRSSPAVAVGPCLGVSAATEHQHADLDSVDPNLPGRNGRHDALRGESRSWTKVFPPGG